MLLVLALCNINFANAATESKDIQSSARVNASCELFTPGSVNFGVLSTTSTVDADDLRYLRIKCTNGTSFNVSYSTGNGTYEQRIMKHSDGTEELKYQLYASDARTIVAGDGTQGTQTHSHISNGSLISFTLNLVVNKNQYVKVGNYSDNIVVTATY